MAKKVRTNILARAVVLSNEICADHANSCYCQNLKVASDPVRVFNNFLTPAPDPGRKKTQNPAGVDSVTPDPWPLLKLISVWESLSICRFLMLVFVMVDLLIIPY